MTDDLAPSLLWRSQGECLKLKRDIRQFEKKRYKKKNKKKDLNIDITLIHRLNFIDDWILELLQRWNQDLHNRYTTVRIFLITFFTKKEKKKSKPWWARPLQSQLGTWLEK